MARKQASSHVLVKKLRDGWYYRRGSGAAYPWIGPFETEHVAEKVREWATGGAWGTQEKGRGHSTKQGSAHATAKVDRRKIRYVALAWSNPPGYSQRFVEGNFPESDVQTILEGLFQRGIPEVNVEGRDFALPSLDAVYEAVSHVHDSVSRRRR